MPCCGKWRKRCKVRFPPLAASAEWAGKFGVLLMGGITEEELRQKLDAFQSGIAAILPAPEKVSCSIGACWFTHPQDIQTIYPQTDRLLYAAKRQGRACYVMGVWQNGHLRVIERAGDLS